MRLFSYIRFLVLAIALASGAAFADQHDGEQRPQGLYSAEQLLEADVFAKDSGDKIGEIEDIVFDNEMRIESFAVQTESSFGLGGKSYVVSPDQISVDARESDEATEPEYRITMDATAEQLRQNPVYSDSWWNQTQQQAGQAWEQTKAKASSAWVTIKRGTAEILSETGEAAGKAADKIGDSADDAAAGAGEAAEDSGEAAGNAAENTKEAAEDAGN